jgi:GNAT superfamily N-acetyltransferase
MSNIEIQPVATRRARKQFLSLPWMLYKDDPNWTPPLRMNQKELVNYKKHPFYDDAEIQTFLALRDGQPAGRIAAILNHAHNRQHKENRGFFGFFESVDDPGVAHGLLDAAREWFADRGVMSLRGPTNPSLNYECGLLVDGFDWPAFFMMTYNPPYYAKLIESWGFEKVQDLYAFWGHTNMIEGLDSKLKFVVNEATERFNVKLRPMNRKDFLNDVKLFLNIYNESLSATWGFAPLSESEIQHMAAGLKHLIVPELALIGEIDGRPIGAVFAFLDYNPRIKEIDGRLFPTGLFKLLTNRRKIKNFRIIAANVVPEFQRWGLGLVLVDGLLPMIYDWGIEEVEFSWVLESNALSRRSLERGGAMLRKTYRIYDYEP